METNDTEQNKENALEAEGDSMQTVVMPPIYGTKTILHGTHHSVWWEMRTKGGHELVGLGGRTLKEARSNAVTAWSNPA